jgi:hypothetical protein
MRSCRSALAHWEARAIATPGDPYLQCAAVSALCAPGVVPTYGLEDSVAALATLLRTVARYVWTWLTFHRSDRRCAQPIQPVAHCFGSSNNIVDLLRGHGAQ